VEAEEGGEEEREGGRWRGDEMGERWGDGGVEVGGEDRAGRRGR
jgi:hypothetical protein